MECTSGFARKTVWAVQMTRLCEQEILTWHAQTWMPITQANMQRNELAISESNFTEDARMGKMKIENERLLCTSLGPVFFFPFWGFQVKEKMPPIFPSTFSPCKEHAQTVPLAIGSIQVKSLMGNLDNAKKKAVHLPL